MKEYTFEELGYFAERECQAIKDCLQGYSYMNFDISLQYSLSWLVS